MGRGRQKAKMTKKARELKYSSPATDFGALQNELSAHHTNNRYRDDDETPENEAPDVDEEDWAPHKK